MTGESYSDEGCSLLMERLNLNEGTFEGTPPQSRRTLGDLAALFQDQEALSGMDLTQVVYETHGCPGEAEGPARLLYATTVLYPGQVGDEYFMTRGHFHLDPTRGENMLTLRGRGALILMDREGKTWKEDLAPGSVHDIDGLHAHRVANTGNEPLVFYVTWLSDCGHEYGKGFGKVLLASEAGPLLT